MPAEFTKCVADGGKVITEVIKKGETYIHVCYINGKSYSGEVKHYKKLSRGKSKNSKA
jgi:hypothetical protein